MSALDRNQVPARDQVPGLVKYKISFAPNGSSAIDATSNKGAGGTSRWSVAYTSTGLYTITLVDTFIDFNMILPSLQLTTGDDKYCQVGVTSVTARTVQIRVWDASAAAVADVAADAGNRINVIIVVRCSQVTS